MSRSSQKEGNKKRLGRGLDSLLGASAGDFGSNTPGMDTQANQEAPVPKESTEDLRSAPEKVTEKPDQNKMKSAIKITKPTPVPEKSTDNSSLSDMSRVWSLAIEKVVPNQTQPRKDFHKEALEELAASIKEQGIIQPITVRKFNGKYEIIAGERRWRASQLAGLQEIPAIIKDVDDQKSMELALIENLQREDLNAVEEAMGYQLLIDDYDLSQQELATKVGKSRSAVTNALRVLTLPRDIRQMVRQSLLSMGHAKVLMGVEDPKLQVKLARKTVQKKMSVRALENELKKPTSSTSDSNLGEMNVSERLAKGLADDLQKILGTKVGIQYKNGKGRLEIAFYSDDELSQFCEKIKNTWSEA